MSEVENYSRVVVAHMRDWATRALGEGRADAGLTLLEFADIIEIPQPPP